MTGGPGGAGFDERLRGLTAVFLASLPGRLEDVARGVAAVRAAPASTEALAQLHRTVHKLAGAGATFGMTGVSRAARRLEARLVAPLGSDQPLGEEDLLALDAGVAELHEAARDPAQPRTALLAAAAGPTAQRLVHLVEDDAALAEDLAVQLSFFGYEVRSFGRLLDLEQALASVRPAALIVDVGLAEGPLAGPTWVSRHRDLLAGVPVLFVSVRGDLEARLAAVRCGAAAYLTKPVDVGALVNRLDELAASGTREPLRVLVIDDDEHAASYCTTVLEAAGFAARALHDPLRVAEALADHRPDLLVMDLYMPGCSGPELAAALRMQEAHVGLPIVFLSTETDAGKQADSLAAGGDDFITKPVDPARLVQLVRTRAERARALQARVSRDGLTGLLNHTALLRQLEVEIARARRQISPLSFAMLDLDHFKAVNDTHGHPAGDRVLRTLARLLQEGLRRTDVVGRYGGEEFGLVLPDADGAAAVRLLDDLRLRLARLRLVSDAGQPIQVTFSAGVAAGLLDMQALVAQADVALYQAKRAGRDRVVLAED
jgi:diguanylate cyclase (GGDEF)-like protein